MEHFKAQMKARVRSMVADELRRKDIDQARKDFETAFNNKMISLTVARRKSQSEREEKRMKKIADKQAIIKGLENACLENGAKLFEKMQQKTKTVEQKRKDNQHAHILASQKYNTQLEAAHARVAQKNEAQIQSATDLVSAIDKKLEKAGELRRKHHIPSQRLRKIISCKRKIEQTDLTAASERRKEHLEKKRAILRTHLQKVKLRTNTIKAKPALETTHTDKRSNIVKPMTRKRRKYNVDANLKKILDDRKTRIDVRIQCILARNKKVDRLLDRSSIKLEKQKLVRMNFIERAKISKFMAKLGNSSKFYRLVKKMGIANERDGTTR